MRLRCRLPSGRSRKGRKGEVNESVRSESWFNHTKLFRRLVDRCPSSTPPYAIARDVSSVRERKMRVGGACQKTQGKRGCTAAAKDPGCLLRSRGVSLVSSASVSGRRVNPYIWCEGAGPRNARSTTRRLYEDAVLDASTLNVSARTTYFTHADLRRTPTTGQTGRLSPSSQTNVT